MIKKFGSKENYCIKKAFIREERLTMDKTKDHGIRGQKSTCQNRDEKKKA